MQTSSRLYTLNFDEVKTYLWAAVFVACNLALPRLFHLIPQGGIIFSPLTLVILAGSYKFGWRVGLIAALASPLVNHLFKKCTLLLLIGVILATKLVGGLAELAFTGGIEATVQDFTVGWPGLLLAIVGSYLVCKYL